jgi:hypothetical protein
VDTVGVANSRWYCQRLLASQVFWTSIYSLPSSRSEYKLFKLFLLGELLHPLLTPRTLLRSAEYLTHALRLLFPDAASAPTCVYSRAKRATSHYGQHARERDCACDLVYFFIFISILFSFIVPRLSTLLSSVS